MLKIIFLQKSNSILILINDIQKYEYLDILFIFDVLKFCIDMPWCGIVSSGWILEGYFNLGTVFLPWENV